MDNYFPNTQMPYSHRHVSITDLCKTKHFINVDEVFRYDSISINQCFADFGEILDICSKEAYTCIFTEAARKATSETCGAAGINTSIH